MAIPSIPRLLRIPEVMGLKDRTDSSSSLNSTRSIQKQQGLEPCFASEKGFSCPRTTCEWRRERWRREFGQVVK